jgi:hypothetical protein
MGLLTFFSHERAHSTLPRNTNAQMCFIAPDTQGD